MMQHDAPVILLVPTGKLGELNLFRFGFNKGILDQGVREEH